MGVVTTSEDDENTAVMQWFLNLIKGQGITVVYSDIKNLKEQCANSRPEWFLANRQVDCVFTLYPKEWLITEVAKDDMLKYDLARHKIKEPWWKLIMANKIILPLLWQMYPNHKYLLPAYIEANQVPVS